MEIVLGGGGMERAMMRGNSIKKIGRGIKEMGMEGKREKRKNDWCVRTTLNKKEGTEEKIRDY